VTSYQQVAAWQNDGLNATAIGLSGVADWLSVASILPRSDPAKGLRSNFGTSAAAKPTSAGRRSSRRKPTLAFIIPNRQRERADVLSLGAEWRFERFLRQIEVESGVDVRF
jgi:hypothetical protein